MVRNEHAYGALSISVAGRAYRARIQRHEHVCLSQIRQVVNERVQRERIWQQHRQRLRVAAVGDRYACRERLVAKPRRAERGNEALLAFEELAKLRRVNQLPSQTVDGE